ncbi:hypothetical protein TI04_02855 [Achromatium sp. WMS2]|nr:hypothetical protein TI04_02855 [Achromatium sp. WMS2]
MIGILELLGLRCTEEKRQRVGMSFQHMVAYFVPERVASHTQAIIEYRIAKCGYWHITIADKKVVLHEGSASKPDLIVLADMHTWMDITSGNATGEEMYNRRKLRFRGDQYLFMQLGQIFNREHRAH